MQNNYRVTTITHSGIAKQWFCTSKEAAMNFLMAFIKSGDYIQVAFTELPYVLH